MKSQIHQQCLSCGTVLPEVRHHSTKYCSSQCRQREKLRRYRARKAGLKQTPAEQLAELKVQHDQLAQAYESLNQRLSDRDLKIRRLERALNRAEYQVEAAANEQAERTHHVRQQLAVANSEVAELKRNWTARSNTEDAAGQERDRLRHQLATLSGHYNELAAKYDQLSASAQRAAKERKQLQALVRQWDAMCVRLYKATGGRPRREADKKILATWTQFRKAVRK